MEYFSFEKVWANWPNAVGKRVKTLADFSSYLWSAESATLAALQVLLKQLCHDLGPDRAKHSTNRNQKLRTGKDRTVSDWPESEKEKLESGQRTLEGGKCQ